MNEEKAKELAEALTLGRAAASGLASETDGLTEELAQVERELSELKLGVNSWVELMSEVQGDHDGPQRERMTSLWFRREGKMWRLLIEEGEPGEPDSTRTQLLVNASREHRMRAADLLPELIEKLVQVAVKRREEVRQKAESVRAVRAVIKQVRGGHRDGDR